MLMKKIPEIPLPLVVLEMANNHMGSVDHGLSLIDRFADICKEFPRFSFAIKLQYRQMDSFIHPDFKDRMDLKYVKRFMETRLSEEDFQSLISRIKSYGLLTMCTPFDNESVAKIVEHGFDILKIASCSFNDWPLLEEIALTDLPLIASTAGANQDDLDNVVSFLSNRQKVFALNHCVAQYPTPPESIQLNQIDYLKSRYPNLPIGYSTHEPPSFTGSIAMAVAKGAILFERHVALVTDTYQPNAYSATPEQFTQWLSALDQAFDLCGDSAHQRFQTPDEEREALRALRRGVYMKDDTPAGKMLGDEDVFFAIPCQEGQITANEWSKYIPTKLLSATGKHEPLMLKDTHRTHTRAKLKQIVRRINELLHNGNIVVPEEAELEVSHHYGQENFDETGACLITVINRQYCKKLLLVLPGQNHPEHYHQSKDESFYVLHGVLNITLNGESHTLKEGEMITIPAGSRHHFKSETGCVFEEVSTQHKPNDSFYTDPVIMENHHRKTMLRFWQNIK